MDTGSLTRAAIALQVTQPTVTNRIKSLERALGSILLERLPNGVRPTNVGRALVAHARDIVRLSGEVQQLVDVPGELSGRICVGASESLTNHRLVPLIEYMYLRYPRIDFSLRLTAPQEAMAQLLGGQMDCMFKVGEGPSHVDLDYSDLCAEPLVLVSAPGCDPLPDGSGDVSDVDFPSVLVCTDVDVRYCGDLLQGANSPRRTLVLHSVEAVKRMVENGIGVGVLPEVAVAREIAEGSLAQVAWRPLTRTFTQVLWRRSNVYRPALQAVLEAAAKVVREG